MYRAAAIGATLKQHQEQWLTHNCQSSSPMIFCFSRPYTNHRHVTVNVPGLYINTLCIQKAHGYRSQAFNTFADPVSDAWDLQPQPPHRIKTRNVPGLEIARAAWPLVPLQRQGMYAIDGARWALPFACLPLLTATETALNRSEVVEGSAIRYTGECSLSWRGTMRRSTSEPKRWRPTGPGTLQYEGIMNRPRRLLFGCSLQWGPGGTGTCSFIASANEGLEQPSPSAKRTHMLWP